jgi:hypothetical protein
MSDQFRRSRDAERNHRPIASPYPAKLDAIGPFRAISVAFRAISNVA